MKTSLSRSTLLTALVIALLVIATPFAVAEFFKTGEFYLLSRRFADDIVARLHGPGRLRFILQPLVAIVLGTRDGVKDARIGRPPFLRHSDFLQSRTPGTVTQRARVRSRPAGDRDSARRRFTTHHFSDGPSGGCPVDRTGTDRAPLCLFARTCEPRLKMAITPRLHRRRRTHTRAERNVHNQSSAEESTT